MPDALEEFTRETVDRFLKELPVEKRLEGLSPEQRQVLLRLLQTERSSPKP